MSHQPTSFIIILKSSSRMEAQLNKAFHLVSQPNNQAIKQGENMLNFLKKDQNYPIALLQYMNAQSVPPEGKLRAAIELKLWCEFFKGIQEFQRNFYSGVIENVKEQILISYFNFPLQISKTLRPGIVALIDVLFPSYWDNLAINLIHYASQNPRSICAVLKIFQDFTHKYTFLTRSDPLYQEIIKVCDQIHDFLKDLTTNVLQTVISNPNSSEEATILEILMKLFYNLNYQDLHPKYEDNLQHWMSVLKEVMKLPNHNENIFKCKGAALQAILLYANKYKEDVEQTIRDFCFEIWPLCASASQDTEYDSIVFNCLKFFKSLMNWPEMKPFFQQNMDQLFETLILPNIAVNNTASALFQEEIDVFIDYYFRNTEIQTRRAAAIELLRIICRSYNAFQPFLERQIQNFLILPPGNVKAECTLLGLIIDGSSKGFRDIDGCTQLFVSPQLIEYCYQNIAKKSLGEVYNWILQNTGVAVEKKFSTLHVAIIIRFLFYFRVYFPKGELPSILQFLASIKTDDLSLRKVIYLSINGFLLIKHGDFVNYRDLVNYFNPDNLKPIAFNLLSVVYSGTTAQSFLQEGLTKMFHNVAKGLKQANCQFFEPQKLIMKEMLKKTQQYDFNSAQFLFETIGILSYYYIRANSKDRGELQQIVLDFFQSAIKSKSDLLNFCLQVLAIFLQLEQNTNSQYKVIYNALLLTQNWKEENQSVMSSYIQFITAYLARYRDSLVSDRPAIEIILSKIIEIDHIQLFFRFLDAIVQNTTLQEFSRCGYMEIVVKGSQALARTIQGKKAALLFISRLLVLYNIQQPLNIINSFCSNYYDQLLQASLEILQSISLRKDRKCIFAAVCGAISINYFSNPQIEGLVINSLISNTVERFSMRHISGHVQENQSKEKKEATYRKLQVFKEFEKPEVEVQIDEEEFFVKTFKQAVGNRPHLLDFISEKNKERIIRLSQKYSK